MMSIASVSGRIRAQKRAAELQKKGGAPKKWPELSEEERIRLSRIDEAVMRFHGGHKTPGKAKA